MTKEAIKKLNYIIDNVQVSEEKRKELKNAMKEERYKDVIWMLDNLNSKNSEQSEEDIDKKATVEESNNEASASKEGVQELEKELKIENEEDIEELEEETQIEEENENSKIEENEEGSDGEETEGIYPEKLQDIELECNFIGLLLDDPKLITRYYFLYKECLFEDEELLNIYKSILFTEGSKYSSENAKKSFTLPNITQTTNELKVRLKRMVQDKNLDIENVYVRLKKLFVLRKNYLEIPIKSIQDQVVEIIDYELYDKMNIEEVESAVNQVTVTEKFKRGVLNKDLSKFLKESDNTLTNGLDLPFPIISSVFKGLRKGETMSYAMPSNSGKSRFAINLAAYMAFVHKKKVLIISNEMSEEKMKLCLITTIVNNPIIQEIHGQKLRKTEGELLEFQYRPDDPKKIETDEKGFIKKFPNESQKDFVKRVSENSEEFRKTIEVTDWINKEIKNSIYFIHITDHTNDELKKIIMNYYYKEKIEYVFYDTLKTDTENIGNGEEVKRTATILSNLAQNFELFICSSLQLEETETLPVNLTVRDLAVSKTVKEVLDTLCLIKQIHNDSLKNYEYSLNEVDTKFFDLEKFEDPDIRYYACVIDKNRAGAKPKVVFRLNLAYNSWEELGYLRLKQ